MSNPYLTQPEGSNHKVDTDTHVFFYEQDFYVLSNFSSFEVRWPHHEPEAPWFKTAEHLYHYLKFAGIRKDAAVQAAIAVCKARVWAKQAKRCTIGFDTTVKPTVSVNYVELNLVLTKQGAEFNQTKGVEPC